MVFTFELILCNLKLESYPGRRWFYSFFQNGPKVGQPNGSCVEHTSGLYKPNTVETKSKTVETKPKTVEAKPNTIETKSKRVETKHKDLEMDELTIFKEL